MKVPCVPGVISAAQVSQTGATIAELQLDSGMIPWFPGGHADPWNHVEAAMALATAGLTSEAERAYQWLLDRQRPDGSWHNYYLADGIEDPKLDVNCVAYIATGIWHHYLTTGDRDFARSAFPAVDAALEFVLDLQTRRGEILWARHPNGLPWSYALLTGSSSISHSLACGLELAALLGHTRPHWSVARDRLVSTIVDCPDAFEPKDRWAMDWYYPVLVGAVTGDDGLKLLWSRWDEFVMEGRGVRCVSDQPWVTAAETCECAMAMLALGERQPALELFAGANALRDDDGAYFTGRVYPERINYPEGERSSYTAAAVILTADALDGSNPTSSLFTDTRPTDTRPTDTLLTSRC